MGTRARRQRQLPINNCSGRGVATMAAVDTMPPVDASAMKAKQIEEEAAVKVHRIRITLTSRNVNNLEKGDASHDASHQLSQRPTLTILPFGMLATRAPGRQRRMAPVESPPWVEPFQSLTVNP